MISLSSKDYNEILQESLDSLDEIEKKIYFTNKKIESRLEVMNIQNEYNSLMFERIKNSNNNQGELFIDSINNDFDITGITAHPKTIGGKSNILNLTVSKSNNYHYRDDVNCYTSVNGKVINVTDILKHDSIKDKDFNILKSKEDEIALTIQKTNKLGVLYASSFEVDSFLKDSMDITKMIFYRDDIEVTSLENIKNIGKSLHILDERIAFNKVEVFFKLKFNFQNSYIFSLKHLYFYDSLFDNNSFCIIRRELDKSIGYLEDKIVITDHKDKRQTTLTESGIKVFADENLEREIIPEQRIADNYYNLYIKIPLVINEKIQSLKSLKTFVKYR